MGGVYSTTILRQELSKYLNNTTVTEIMDSYSNIFNAKNEISFHNVGNINIGSVRQSNVIKNALFARRVQDITMKYNEFSSIAAEMDKKLKNDGLFAGTSSTTEMENKLTQYIDNTTLMNIRYDVRNSFNLNNILSVHNDVFDPSSSFSSGDIEQTNEAYNKQVVESYLTYLKDTNITLYDKFKGSEALSNTGLTAEMLLWIALGIGGVAVIVIASKMKKK